MACAGVLALQVLQLALESRVSGGSCNVLNQADKVTIMNNNTICNTKRDEEGATVLRAHLDNIYAHCKSITTTHHYTNLPCRMDARAQTADWAR